MPPEVTWLVRHGQSTSNAGLPAVGIGEAPLTELGREQSREVAQRMDRRPDLLVVSAFLRTRETAAPIRERWPDVRCETWPIHELTYLSPRRCHGTTAVTRRPWVDAYWQQCDPDYLDGSDAESFRSFAKRLEAFDRRLRALDDGFAVVVGHGQFFRAWQLGRRLGFEVGPAWMKTYRVDETSRPMVNCEVIEVPGADLARAPSAG